MDDIKKHTLCLNMIVKNEEHVIENVLECVSKYIDYYIISDTGSVDETKQVIKKYFNKLNISGEIHDDKWVNFGYNRTKALEYCVGKCEYCWVIDADDIIIGNLPMPSKLTKDSYKVIYGKDFSYRRNQIFKVDKIWKYVGVLHEYATSENNKNNTVATIEGNYYIDSGRLGDRNKDKNKYKKDIEILLKCAEDEPDNERYIFYLAQSYMDDGQLENSNKYYLKRFNMGGWVEEQYYSLLKIGINNIKLRKTKKIIIDSLLEAFNFRSSRLEALYELVNYLFNNERDKDIKSAAKYAKLGLHIYRTTDTLFVTKSIYEYRFLDITYLVLFYNNEFGEAYKSINNLLNRQKYPENQNIRLQRNRGFCIPKIMDNIIKYPKEKIQFLTENIINKLEIKVLFTITTCKRLDLFINTIHSFINCCEDIDLIDKFICIDDNSSIRERKEMKQKYPFFDFIFKPSREKGHINSMNKILDCINIYNPKYIIHLEDDWNFYAKKCYIKDSIKIIENTKNIKQVLFNKNYAELYDNKSLNLAGGIRKNIDELFYIEHEHYKKNTQELKDFYNRNKGRSSSAYWPHFSFRPSLICCDIFKKIGKYRSNNGHFEMDYANRFFNSGYKSAFFDSLSCYHTGKLTSENNSDKPNAYKLNNVVQFTAKQNKSRNLDNFIFIRNADIFGNDIKFEKKSPYEMANIAIGDEKCIGFNTLGFFKNDIKLLENSKYFGENDGIYIKKEIYEKNIQLLFNSSMTNKKNIRIKMMSAWIESEKLCKEWNIMCERNYRWKNIEITSENHNIDYYVIINKPRKDNIYIPEKTILFQMEPWVRDNNKNWGVKTWCEWSEPDESKFLYVGTHKKSLNNVQWWVTLPLIFPKIRSNRVVSILSYKGWDIGHQLRINISKKSKYIDVFGRDNYHKLNNYLGKLKDDKKESEYVKYKYCLVVENNYEYNYASEKIWDGILCECLCFYWGCPNLSDHIDPNCYVRLDENDIDKSLQIIHNTIKNNLWEQKIEIIKKEKLKIIEELGFFPRINKIINKDRL